jgi:tetratricopeptide (TPR) repeat protein
VTDSRLPAGIPDLDDLKRKGTPYPALMEKEEPAKPVVTLQRYQELEQHLRNSPADADGYLELSRIYLSQGRSFDAKRVLDRAMEHLSDDARIVYEWEEMQVARSRQLLDQAEQAFLQEKTVANREARDRCTIDLANTRIQVCKARLEREPHNLEIALPLANAYRQLGRFQEAIDVLQRAKANSQIRARACLQLGMVFMQIDKPLEAIAAFRQAALYRAPPPPEKIRDKALELAAEVAEKVGLIASARRYVQLRLESNPSDPALLAQQKRLSERTI